MPRTILPGQQEGIGKGVNPLAPEVSSGAKSLVAGTGGNDHETTFVQSAAHGSDAAFHVPAGVGAGGGGWAGRGRCPDTVGRQCTFLDADGSTNTRAAATEVTSGDTAWSNDWYVVSADVNILNHFTLTSHVHLI